MTSQLFGEGFYSYLSLSEALVLKDLLLFYTECYGIHTGIAICITLYLHEMIWNGLHSSITKVDNDDDNDDDEERSSFKSKIEKIKKNFNVHHKQDWNDYVDDNIFTNLPSDVQVKVGSYLHPKDIVTFACVNKSCQKFVDAGPSSRAIWKALFDRDYSWIISLWNVGQQAYQRSQSQLQQSQPLSPGLSSSFHMDCMNSDAKKFYFYFKQSYMNYVLAGCNTNDRCLVGLHGNIYDITKYLDRHPGSPETLLIQCGRDRTTFFEDVRHSGFARRIGQKMCIVVDCSSSTLASGTSKTTNNQSYDHICGLLPTNKTLLTSLSSLKNNDRRNSLYQHSSPSVVPPTTIKINEGIAFISATRHQRNQQNDREKKTYKRRSVATGGTLYRIRTEFKKEEKKQMKLYKQKLSNQPVLGDLKLFFDPFTFQWKAWYTNTEFETVFV